MTAAARKSKEEPNNTRMVAGEYIADVLVDSRQPSRVFHWIVQKVGSAEILQWGQESTFAAAEEAAKEYLGKLNRPKASGNRP